MDQKKYHNQILIILILSLLFRFGYLGFGDVLPVMWDARIYVGAAIGMLSEIDDSGDRPYVDDNDDRKRFQYYTDEYIQGEQIEWLAYKTYTLSEARDLIYISGPLYPALAAVVIYLSPANDFTVLRIINIIFDLLANFLLILIAAKLFEKRTALLCGLLYALYLPFTILSTQLLLESSTIMLMLLAIYLAILAVEKKKVRLIGYAGIILGLLVWNKATAALLIFPIGLAFFMFVRKGMPYKTILKYMLYLIIPLSILTARWMYITYDKYEMLTLRDPSYSEANLRSSSSIPFEAYDLDLVERDFWSYSVADHIIENPLGYLGLLGKKFERMWSQPANDFKKEFILPLPFQKIMHTTIIFFGLLGIVYMFIAGRQAVWWILSIGGYYTLIHVIFHSLARYNIIVMPLIMISAAAFIFYAYDKLISKPDKNKSFVMIFVLLAAGYFIDAKLFSPESYFLLIIICLIKFGLIAKAICLIGSNLFAESKNKHTIVLISTFALMFLIFSYSTVFSRMEWAEFKYELNDSSVKAGTRVYISDLGPVASNEMIAAVVDLNSPPGRHNSFTLSIGDFQNNYIGGQPPLIDLFYPKPTYRYYSKFVPIAIETFRQYAFIPMEYDSVKLWQKRDGYIDINVAINDSYQEENNYINLYGSYDANQEQRYIPGARFTSIERFVHKDDPRIRYPVIILSDSAKSYYINRNEDFINYAKNTPGKGAINGRLNMYLIHFKPDGSFSVY